MSRRLFRLCQYPFPFVVSSYSRLPFPLSSLSPLPFFRSITSCSLSRPTRMQYPSPLLRRRRRLRCSCLPLPSAQTPPLPTPLLSALVLDLLPPVLFRSVADEHSKPTSSSQPPLLASMFSSSLEEISLLLFLLLTPPFLDLALPLSFSVSSPFLVRHPSQTPLFLPSHGDEKKQNGSHLTSTYLRRRSPLRLNTAAKGRREHDGELSGYGSADGSEWGAFLFVLACFAVSDDRADELCATAGCTSSHALTRVVGNADISPHPLPPLPSSFSSFLRRLRTNAARPLRRQDSQRDLHPLRQVRSLSSSPPSLASMVKQS